LPAGYEFHHLGYATASIEKERELFTLLGYRQEGKTFADPIQGVAGCFLTSRGPRIEILENLAGSSTLTSWLNAGIRLYHFAYLVANLEDAIAWARGLRAKVAVEPVPSVAFDGRRISFVMLRNGLMLEFIESGGEGNLKSHCSRQPGSIQGVTGAGCES
jgi:methylmalonyl-CoA/ethylmalonyl-CoA epimerase